MTPIARRIARWVAEQSYDQIPESTVHEVKRRVIDTLGVAIGAYTAPPCRIARAVAESTHDTHAGTVWGTTHSSRPGLVAFANGTMVRYLDFNDAYISAECAHPSDNIPAAVAVAQSAGLGGKEAILGMVIAYEIQCRLCDAGALRLAGWDHVIYAALSTAMAAGKLWGLDEDGLVQALQMAGVCNIATRQTRRGHISVWHACAAGNASRNGVFAADLARRGLDGPNEIFEGSRGLMNQLCIPDVERLKLAESGHYRVSRCHIKAWPAGTFAQPAIDAILQLRPQIELEQVESIQIDTCEAAEAVMASEPQKWRPASRETAANSLPYCCAVALADGDVTPDSFAEERLTDPQMFDLMDKVKVAEDPELNRRFPEGIPARATIAMVGGRKVEQRVDYPRGHIRNPMSDDELVAKFRRLADGMITDETAERILAAAWRLEELTELRDLFEFGMIHPDANAAAMRPRALPKKLVKTDDA
ncbi:MAG TPA: MmgE/PrpD family protein [Phycisphaerae bacterium]|nr:MmgE/PrpD family protein [Phycisphaerae bacterium]